LDKNLIDSWRISEVLKDINFTIDENIDVNQSNIFQIDIVLNQRIKISRRILNIIIFIKNKLKYNFRKSQL